MHVNLNGKMYKDLKVCDKMHKKVKFEV